MEQHIYTKEKHELGQVNSQASLQSWRRQEPAVEASKRTENRQSFPKRLYSNKFSLLQGFTPFLFIRTDEQNRMTSKKFTSR